MTILNKQALLTHDQEGLVCFMLICLLLSWRRWGGRHYSWRNRRTVKVYILKFQTIEVNRSENGTPNLQINIFNRNGTKCSKRIAFYIPH